MVPFGYERNVPLSGLVWSRRIPLLRVLIWLILVVFLHDQGDFISSKTQVFQQLSYVNVPRHQAIHGYDFVARFKLQGKSKNSQQVIDSTLFRSASEKASS